MCPCPHLQNSHPGLLPIGSPLQPVDDAVQVGHLLVPLQVGVHLGGVQGPGWAMVAGTQHLGRRVLGGDGEMGAEEEGTATRTSWRPGEEAAEAKFSDTSRLHEDSEADLKLRGSGCSRLPPLTLRERGCSEGAGWGGPAWERSPGAAWE